MKIFRASAFLLFLFPLLGFAADEFRPQKLSSFTAKGCSVSEPLMVETLERESLEEMKKHAPRVPQVAFGFENAAWLVFKAKIRPNDTLVRLTCGRDTYWLGYAIVRSDVVIATFVLELS